MKKIQWNTSEMHALSPKGISGVIGRVYSTQDNCVSCTESLIFLGPYLELTQHSLPRKNWSQYYGQWSPHMFMSVNHSESHTSHCDMFVPTVDNGEQIVPSSDYRPTMWLGNGSLVWNNPAKSGVGGFQDCLLLVQRNTAVRSQSNNSRLQLMFCS